MIVGLARENPRCGYQRIVGELKFLGRRRGGDDCEEGPAHNSAQRRGLSWRELLRAQANTVMAVDFFTVDTVWLQRVYVLFFIEIGRRRLQSYQRVNEHNGASRRHQLPEDYRVAATPILSGLHHEYRLEQKA